MLQHHTYPFTKSRDKPWRWHFGFGDSDKNSILGRDWNNCLEWFGMCEVQLQKAKWHAYLLLNEETCITLSERHNISIAKQSQTKQKGTQEQNSKQTETNKYIYEQHLDAGPVKVVFCLPKCEDFIWSFFMARVIMHRLWADTLGRKTKIKCTYSTFKAHFKAHFPFSTFTNSELRTFIF